MVRAGLYDGAADEGSLQSFHLEAQCGLSFVAADSHRSTSALHDLSPQRLEAFGSRKTRSHLKSHEKAVDIS
jgi:hypothetical protein